MFCQACEDIQLSRWQKYRPGESGIKLRFGHIKTNKGWATSGNSSHVHTTLSQASQSARDGCHLCSFILEALFRTQNGPEAADSLPVLLAGHEIVFLQTRFKLSVACGPLKAELHILQLPRKFAHRSAFTFAQPEEDWSTGSQNSLQLGRLWLDRCQSSHPECRSREVTNPVLPDYVLDVGNSQSPDAFLVRGEGQRARYATLSYCWGQLKQTAKTTTINLASQMAGIDIGELPQTLQDAIHTARVLDIRYLWIDALCIIQDSRQHWEEQSALMGSIYANSTLTIGADATPAADLGCFVRRNPQAARPCPIPPTALESLYEPDQQHERLHLCHGARDDPIRSKTTSAASREITADEAIDGTTPTPTPSPLDGRAWVLQESLLSRRTLKFTATGVAWNCLSENLDEGSPTVDWASSPPLSWNPVYCDNGQAWDLYNQWHLRMMQYGERQITYLTDRLPALSALASKFADMMRAAGSPDTYLAGLWRGDLAYGLSWIRRDNSRPCRPGPADDWIAPTWSWASALPGPIEFPLHNPPDIEPELEPLESFSVEDARCEPFGSDPHGRIKSGSLLVRGWVVETVVFDTKPQGPIGSWWRTDAWLGLISTELGLIAGAIRLDEPGRPNGPVLCLALTRRPVDAKEVAARISAFNELLSHGGTALTVNTRGHRVRLLEKMKTSALGRMLKPSQREVYRALALISEGPDRYRRIGIAEIWLDSLEGRPTQALTIV